MATSNVSIDLNWVQVAAPADNPVLISWIGSVAVEFACTDTTTVPVIGGHVLQPGQAITRSLVGNGYIWARTVNASAKLVVTK